MVIAIELVVIVIVSLSASVKNTLFTNVSSAEFSLRLAVTDVITLPAFSRFL